MHTNFTSIAFFKNSLMLRKEHLYRRLFLCLFGITGCSMLGQAQPTPTKKQHVFQEVKSTLSPYINKEAQWAMQQEVKTIVHFPAERSAGGLHDFYSEGDYWWPDPASPDSPYVQRDGRSNPENFIAHRAAMIRFANIMGALGSAWLVEPKSEYVVAAMKHADAWFRNPATRMNPSLLYAQAIKGRATGRGIGIIDAIHLIEVAQTLFLFQHSPDADASVMAAAVDWFKTYLLWLKEHPYGQAEMNAQNNHGTCWAMQVAVFARFVQQEELLQFCRDRYKNVFLPQQMATDGSFPLELKRTKPYGYALFNTEAMVLLVHVLDQAKEKIDKPLWNYTNNEAKSIEKAVNWILPYVEDKSTWPYPKDVMYWEEWPVAQPFLLFAALYTNEGAHQKRLLQAWKKLEHQPTTVEVIRNLPVRHPLIWLPPQE